MVKDINIVTDAALVIERLESIGLSKIFDNVKKSENNFPIVQEHLNGEAADFFCFWNDTTPEYAWVRVSNYKSQPEIIKLLSDILCLNVKAKATFET